MNYKKVDLPDGLQAVGFSDADFIIKEIWENRCYEQDLMLAPGDSVIDLGANQGFFSLFAASRGCRVYAVEPDARNFDVLQKNIALNNFEDLISVFNFAVAEEDGEIDLFIPSSDKLGTSGLITTNLEVSKTFDRLNLNLGKTQKVTGKSFHSLMGLIPDTDIKLLKVDCEGAELSILLGGVNEDFRKIENVVMETHAGYEEHDLCRVIQSAGFTIRAYEKLNGKFSTGYLFATRVPESFESVTRMPVAISNLPESCIFGESICATSSNSFSIRDVSIPVEKCWYLNDELISSEPKLECVLTQKGRNKISLVVKDGDQEDRTDKYVWCFSSEYPQHAERVVPLEMLQTSSLEVDRSISIVVSKQSFPKDWSYSALGLRVIFPNWHSVSEEKSISLDIDGERIPLNSNDNQVYFEHFPSDIDLVFTINTSCPIDLTLKCFATNEVEEKNDSIVWKKGESIVNMKCQQRYACKLLPETEFLLDTALQGTLGEWVPDVIKFGVYPHEEDSQSIEGYVQVGDKQYELTGFGCVVSLDFDKSVDALPLKMVVPQERIYTIVWWRE